jgi:B3/4 domain
MRQDPVPWAYRVFWRQVGIDPDRDRTPAERVALERMKEGGFRSRSAVDDALTVAVAETGVPVVAFDADRVEGGVGLRLSRHEETLGERGRPLPPRQIVIADERPARRSLHDQIGRLEAELGQLFCSAWPRKDLMPTPAGARRGGPRLLGLGDWRSCATSWPSGSRPRGARSATAPPSRSETAG